MFGSQARFYGLRMVMGGGSKSGIDHGDLLKGHIQYVGRSLKVNGRTGGMPTLPYLLLLDWHDVFFSSRNYQVYGKEQLEGESTALTCPFR